MLNSPLPVRVAALGPVAPVRQDSFARRTRIVMQDTARWDGIRPCALARGSYRCAPTVPSSAHEEWRPRMLVELRAPDVDEKNCETNPITAQESWRNWPGEMLSDTGPHGGVRDPCPCRSPLPGRPEPFALVADGGAQACRGSAEVHGRGQPGYYPQHDDDRDGIACGGMGLRRVHEWRIVPFERRYPEDPASCRRRYGHAVGGGCDERYPESARRLVRSVQRA
jgi:hypothetical protein